MMVFPNILVNVSTLFHSRPDFLKKNTTIIEYDCIGLGTMSNSARWHKLTSPFKDLFDYGKDIQLQLDFVLFESWILLFKLPCEFLAKHFSLEKKNDKKLQNNIL
jgi:hypothetical protein